MTWQEYLQDALSRITRDKENIALGKYASGQPVGLMSGEVDSVANALNRRGYTSGGYPIDLPDFMRQQTADIAKAEVTPQLKMPPTQSYAPADNPIYRWLQSLQERR